MSDSTLQRPHVKISVGSLPALKQIKVICCNEHLCQNGHASFLLMGPDYRVQLLSLAALGTCVYVHLRCLSEPVYRQASCSFWQASQSQPSTHPLSSVPAQRVCCMRTSLMLIALDNNGCMPRFPFRPLKLFSLEPLQQCAGINACGLEIVKCCTSAVQT